MSAETAEFWLNQFNLEDRTDAKRLLSAIRHVTADEFHEVMTDLVRSRVVANPAPIGIFVEAERGHRRGRAYRLFTETSRQPRRAFGPGPPVINPTRTVDPEVGSEGPISQIVTGVVRQHGKRATLHPGPDTIRSREVRRFILVTDFIGSGNRATRYLDAAWHVRSVRSWWSARRTCGMSFEVVSYSATEAGQKRVAAHPTGPTLYIAQGCPTIEQLFDVPTVRCRMLELCKRYGSFNHRVDPLGYGGTGALITFAHGMPNNAPAMFHKQSKLKTRPWIPLYPERVTSGRRTGIFPITEQRKAIQVELQKFAKQKALLSPRFLSAPLVLRDAVSVLLSLDRSPRSVIAISARTGFSVERVQDALARISGYGWTDHKHRIVNKGRRELVRLSAPTRKEVQFNSPSLYTPRSLRAPRAI